MENLTIGLLLITCLFIATPSIHAKKQVPVAAAGKNQWFQTISRGGKRITKIHVYAHDVRGGPNATLYSVATASITATSPTSFGQINVFDDRATAEPNINSEEVARFQGSTTSADLSVRAIAMNLNVLLKSGKFNGSTISIVGRNPVREPQRELIVVGGTGAFRYARGYAITSTYFNDAQTNYGILEYTIFVTTFSRVGLWPDM